MKLMLTLLAALCAGSCAASHGGGPVGVPGRVELSMDDWVVEQEKPGRVEVREGKLVVDVPAGVSVWYRRELTSPVVIEYTARAVSAGGANDRVSDLNCFWMATNTDGSAPFTTPRSGKFSTYDSLLTYYVGMGGNANTTTRFRRYTGTPGTRPLLPEHDLKDKKFLLEPNRDYRIRLVADGGDVRFYRDGELVFRLADEKPYTRGYFAIRSVTSHLVISDLVITSRR